MLVIEKQKIDEFVQDLAKTATVIVPVRKTSQEAVESIFEQFSPENPPAGGIDFNYLPTLRSAKEFFFPANEDTFVFNKRKNQVAIPTQGKPFIIFGLNQRDLEALIQLDEIMEKPNVDFFYFQKRKMATIIGLINEPVKTPAGGDLILIKINDEQYEAMPLTEKGRTLVKKRFFKKESAVITNVGAKSEEIMPRLKQLLLDPEFLADVIKWSWRQDLAIWDELATLCLGCGICAYVCPLCHCFSVEDKVDLNGKTCIRCRSWDACTLPKFSQVSGGYNFHKTIRERYYNWFFHKFVRAYKEYGKSQCVACGRCQKYCPAKIDIEKYILKMVDTYTKAKRI